MIICSQNDSKHKKVKKMILTGMKLMSATIIALAGYGASCQYFQTQADSEKFSPIGKLIDIGGYCLHMIDSASDDCGYDDPEDFKKVAQVAQNSKYTVVMDAGFGCASLDWSLVQPEVAQFVRVITYDRAGYGWSDASPFERTSRNIVLELHRMLQAARVPGPYILVGHSFGGCNMQIFAAHYPQEVAGLILVDAVHEEQINVLPPPAAPYFQALTGIVYLGALRFLAKMPYIQDVLKEQIVKFSPRIQQIYYSQSLTNKYADALRSEAFFAPEDCRYLHEVGDDFGSLPITVISAGLPFMSYQKGQAFYRKDQIYMMNQLWPELQKKLTTKSTKSCHIIAENSGHRIPFDSPNVIINAIYDMVKQLA